jgi:hypothetical protein
MCCDARVAYLSTGASLHFCTHFLVAEVSGGYGGTAGGAFVGTNSTGSKVVTSTSASAVPLTDVVTKAAGVHALSQELRMYFEKVVSAVRAPSEHADQLTSVCTCVRSDPGLQQLAPYFSHFIANEVCATVPLYDASFPHSVFTSCFILQL